jgi:hypothetical protein
MNKNILIGLSIIGLSVVVFVVYKYKKSSKEAEAQKAMEAQKVMEAQLPMATKVVPNNQMYSKAELDMIEKQRIAYEKALKL